VRSIPVRSDQYLKGSVPLLRSQPRLPVTRAASHMRGASTSFRLLSETKLRWENWSRWH
jgi:hypothetical protein